MAKIKKTHTLDKEILKVVAKAAKKEDRTSSYIINKALIFPDWWMQNYISKEFVDSRSKDVR